MSTPYSHSSPGTTVWLHLGFAFSGIGTVLLGCILPQLAKRAHLNDKQSGLLLLAQFAAAAFGALLVRRHYWRTLGLGYLLVSTSSFGIVALRASAFLPMFALFGLGLGLVMTSTSILIGRMYPEHKGSALGILNFSWSVGAVGCPLLVGHFMGKANPSLAYAPIAMVAVLFMLLSLTDLRNVKVSQKSDVLPGLSGDGRIAGYFSILAFLYVGVEATVGNWISTYSTRDIFGNLRHSTLAVTCFWSALLIGRLATPAFLILLSERTLYRASAVLLTVAVLLMVFAHSPAALMMSVALTGLALAPLYPLILSLSMSQVGESPKLGWVFATAGFGGATLSWLTGLISSMTSSLRIGLAVPATAASAMIILIFGFDHLSRRSIESEAVGEAAPGQDFL